jgi:hypothetical protein
MPSTAYLMLSRPPPGPRFARPEDKLRGRVEARTVASAALLFDPNLIPANFLTPSFAGMTNVFCNYGNF